MFTPDNKNFQTPPAVCKHMAEMAAHISVPKASLIEFPFVSVLEPTPGKGNLIAALNDLSWGFSVYGPGDSDFWTSWVNTNGRRYDIVVMNPPFNPVSEMLAFVTRAMELSDNIIALLPWSFIVNSEKRLIALQEFGLVSITNLPRKTFPGCRVQVAIFELKKGYAGKTEFKRFSW